LNSLSHNEQAFVQVGNERSVCPAHDHCSIYKLKFIVWSDGQMLFITLKPKLCLNIAEAKTPGPIAQNSLYRALLVLIYLILQARKIDATIGIKNMLKVGVVSVRLVYTKLKDPPNNAPKTVHPMQIILLLLLSVILELSFE
jgi:hypothetical protein